MTECEENCPRHLCIRSLWGKKNMVAIESSVVIASGND